MRIPSIMFFAMIGSLIFAQPSNPGGSQKPSAIVQLQRDAFGANLVRISIFETGYPIATLQAQSEKVGILAGSGSRGIHITDDPIDPERPQDSKLLRATFAVDGLIDKKGQWLKIAPIVKALAGAPSPHQLENILIDFDFEKVSPPDLQDFDSPSVSVARRIVDKSLEYSVVLKTQDPQKIDLPDFVSGSSNNSEIKPTNGPDWLIIGTIAIAVVAFGALVYSLFLLNTSPRKKRRV